jgi:hypothetical protein
MGSMWNQPPNSSLGRASGRENASNVSLRPRKSSLPTGHPNHSRATVNTQDTQTTSVYTFSSSTNGSEHHHNAGQQEPMGEETEHQPTGLDSKRSILSWTLLLHQIENPSLCQHRRHPYLVAILSIQTQPVYQNQLHQLHLLGQSVILSLSKQKGQPLHRSKLFA